MRVVIFSFPPSPHPLCSFLHPPWSFPPPYINRVSHGWPSNRIPSSSLKRLSPREWMASKFLSTMPYSLQPGRYGETAPFNLARIVGNISKCAGCGNKYCKPLVPPYDLCVQHREWRSFTSPGGGPQSKFLPSYYHVNLQCIRRNWPLFSPRHLIISPEMSSKLTPVHKEFLASFGYVL